MPSKLLLTLARTLALCLCVAPTIARPDSTAVYAADSAIARGQGNGLSSAGVPLVSYEHGEFWWALRLLYERDGDAKYLQYIKDGVGKIVWDNGTVHGSYSIPEYTMDPVRTGPTFLYLYSLTGEQKYKTAAQTFRTQLNGHPRTAQGQFWHKLRYPNQGWLDGIYMGTIFYAQWTRDFDPYNTTAWEDITKQYTLMYENTFVTNSSSPFAGLLYHGYDYSHTTVWASVDRGHSPEVWDRALGWYSMALVDILEIIPTISGHTIILNILQELFPKIINAADPATGAWWLVMTQPGRTRNYLESSGAAMFVYSILKALRLGYLEDSDGAILAATKKAYEYMLKTFVTDKTDGTMDWLQTVIVGSLDRAGDFNYYISQRINLNDLKGLAAFVLASLEYEAAVA